MKDCAYRLKADNISEDDAMGELVNIQNNLLKTYYTYIEYLKIIPEDEIDMVEAYIHQPCFAQYVSKSREEFEKDMEELFGEGDKSEPTTKPNPESKSYYKNLDWNDMSTVRELPMCPETPGCIYKTFTKTKKEYKCPDTPEKRKNYLVEVTNLINDIAKAGIIENTDDTKFAFLRTLTGIYIETDVAKVEIKPNNPTTKDDRAMKIDINLNAVLFICKEMFEDKLSLVFDMFDCNNTYGTSYPKNAQLDDRLGDTKKKIEGDLENIKKKAAS